MPAPHPIAQVAAYFATSLVTGALLAPVASWLIPSLASGGIVRVTGRCMLLAAILLAPVLLRCSSVSSRAAFGTDLSGALLLRGLLLGFALGAITFMPHVALLVGLGIRAGSMDGAGPAAVILATLPTALGAGLLVALVEESLFRGVLFGAARAAGPRVAITLSALLYAVAHFLRPESAAHFAGPVHWYSGFAVIAAGLSRFVDAGSLAGDFLALLAAGIALGLIRERSRHIAVTIGVHAAWVACIKITRATSDVAPGSPWAWLVGDFDGVIGYLAAAWISLAVLAVLARGKRVVSS